MTTFTASPKKISSFEKSSVELLPKEDLTYQQYLNSNTHFLDHLQVASNGRFLKNEVNENN